MAPGPGRFRVITYLYLKIRLYTIYVAVVIINYCRAFNNIVWIYNGLFQLIRIKVDVGIMGHLSSSVNFLGCDHWKKARFMVLHNKDMEILKIKLFQ